MSDSKNVIILGANGQLGQALQKLYPNAKAGDTDMLDITDLGAVMAFDWSPYSAIINAAAYTNVDGAETTEGRRIAWAVNAVGPANLAQAAAKADIPLVHISSDYAFDGEKTSPYTETDPFCPLGVYATSKTAADIAVASHPKHYIIRTSWVMGEGRNFVRILLDVGKKGINPAVVSDQIGRPTFTADLAAGIQHLLSTNATYGTYNLSNSGEPVSWADLTRAAYQFAKFSNTVTNTTAEEYFKDKQPSSPRPAYSVLSLDKITAAGFTPKDWKVALEAYVASELSKEQEPTA